ncbi:mechanosensitive ion channel family protein [Methylobacillus flagellatus]|uniref:MscS Mechanosensitive ion channel n=1 Tax=Methylobacillus flagellatus (strain ATCC 51484 / DSM 6875 / VKM B-1610 / KT) TaxID=265072 RepID=Q1GY11_METFK|nr:mechanosensitive ion channel family protein [Methylobacillus flagellatus]ABE50876.1 MscS Mechanosensitive ion channel [Methylobacillus flagellatus KT]
MPSFLAFLGTPDNIIPLIMSALRITFVVLAAILLIRFCNKAIRMLKNRLRARAQRNLEELKRIETLGRVISYVATTVIGTIAVIEVLHEFGISLAPVLAAAGIVGVAVGFGAQSLVKDYFNGLVMLLENQIRQGDSIETAGKKGTVEEVTLRHIRLRDYEGTVHFIPNSVITTVSNMSRGFAYAVIDIKVPIASDFTHIMQVMRSIGTQLRADEDFRDKIQGDLEIAGIEHMDHETAVLRARFQVRPQDKGSVRREFMYRVKQALDTPVQSAE